MARNRRTFSLCCVSSSLIVEEELLASVLNEFALHPQFRLLIAVSVERTEVPSEF